MSSIGEDCKFNSNLIQTMFAPSGAARLHDKGSEKGKIVFHYRLPTTAKLERVVTLATQILCPFVSMLVITVFFLR